MPHHDLSIYVVLVPGKNDVCRIAHRQLFIVHINELEWALFDEFVDPRLQLRHAQIDRLDPALKTQVMRTNMPKCSRKRSIKPSLHLNIVL